MKMDYSTSEALSRRTLNDSVIFIPAHKASLVSMVELNKVIVSGSLSLSLSFKAE